MDKTEVEYEIRPVTEPASGVEIVGRVRGKAHTLLVVSLEVDGIELLPSARLVFASDGFLELPPVRVYRPLPGRDYLLRMVLRTPDGEETVETALTLAAALDRPCAHNYAISSETWFVLDECPPGSLMDFVNHLCNDEEIPPSEDEKEDSSKSTVDHT